MPETIQSIKSNARIYSTKLFGYPDKKKNQVIYKEKNRLSSEFWQILCQQAMKLKKNKER